MEFGDFEDKDEELFTVESMRNRLSKEAGTEMVERGNLPQRNSSSHSRVSDQ